MQVDSNLVADVLHVDLRADKIYVVDSALIHTGHSSDHDIPPANYAVPSQELSLCLRVLVQNRQQRIQELQLQLQRPEKFNSRKKREQILGVTTQSVRTNLLQL